MPTRRQLLGGLAATLAPAPAWSDAGAPAYLAAAQERDGRYALYGLGAGGQDRFRIPLPERGHAAAAHPSRPEAVAFARRPGLFALVLDCRTGRVLSALDAPADRHFYGHGCFSADGTRLFTTENAIASGEGRIGLWAADDGYRRVGEIGSGGIGPHEIVRLPGTDTIVVANGGIRTHPATGREKLNLPTMRPTLTYLSAEGSVLDRVELAEAHRQNSIRHLAVRSDGLLAAALQWQGEPAEAPPLLMLHRLGGAPALLGDDSPGHARLEGYAGSVAFSGDGRRVGITAPRGNRAQIFDAETGELSAEIRRPDICGIAPGGEGFLATDGLGGVSEIGGAALNPLGKADRAWDNHLVAIC